MMPVDLPNGKVLVCPACHEDLRVAWNFLLDPPEVITFCSCRGSIMESGYTDDELRVMIKEQGGKE